MQTVGQSQELMVYNGQEGDVSLSSVQFFIEVMGKQKQLLWIYAPVTKVSLKAVILFFAQLTTALVW